MSYEQLALQYAEKYGISEYRLKGCKMIYNVSFPDYLYQKRYTVQHTVDLRTMTETIRKLSRYCRDGGYNR